MAITNRQRKFIFKKLASLRDFQEELEKLGVTAVEMATLLKEEIDYIKEKMQSGERGPYLSSRVDALIRLYMQILERRELSEKFDETVDRLASYGNAELQAKILSELTNGRITE